MSVTDIIDGARKVPVTVVNLSDYRRHPVSGLPELIVKTLSSIITRAYDLPAMSEEQGKQVRTAALLVQDFGPTLTTEVAARQFASSLTYCWNLLDRMAPSVERDAAIEAECCRLLGVEA
jgi:hypothetical protein